MSGPGTLLHSQDVSDDAHLHSSMRQVWLIMNGHAVNVDRTTFDSFGDLKSLLVILSPNASVQTDFRIVRDLDSFFYVLDSNNDQGGTESLLVINILGRVDSVKNDRRIRCQVILRRSCNSTKTCGTLIEKGFINRLISSREELLSITHL